MNKYEEMRDNYNTLLDAIMEENTQRQTAEEKYKQLKEENTLLRNALQLFVDIYDSAPDNDPTYGGITNKPFLWAKEVLYPTRKMNDELDREPIMEGDYRYYVPGEATA